MTITATELKTNMGKYLSLAGNEDIIITKNGKWVAKLCPPSVEDKLNALRSLKGITSGNPINLDDAKEERLARQCK